MAVTTSPGTFSDADGLDAWMARTVASLIAVTAAETSLLPDFRRSRNSMPAPNIERKSRDAAWSPIFIRRTNSAKPASFDDDAASWLNAILARKRSYYDPDLIIVKNNSASGCLYGVTQKQAASVADRTRARSVSIWRDLFPGEIRSLDLFLPHRAGGSNGLALAGTSVPRAQRSVLGLDQVYTAHTESISRRSRRAIRCGSPKIDPLTSDHAAMRS